MFGISELRQIIHRLIFLSYETSWLDNQSEQRSSVRVTVGKINKEDNDKGSCLASPPRPHVSINRSWQGSIMCNETMYEHIYVVENVGIFNGEEMNEVVRFQMFLLGDGYSMKLLCTFVNVCIWGYERENCWHFQEIWGIFS